MPICFGRSEPVLLLILLAIYGCQDPVGPASGGEGIPQPGITEIELRVSKDFGGRCPWYVPNCWNADAGFEDDVLQAMNDELDSTNYICSQLIDAAENAISDLYEHDSWEAGGQIHNGFYVHGDADWGVSREPDGRSPGWVAFHEAYHVWLASESSTEDEEEDADWWANKCTNTYD